MSPAATPIKSAAKGISADAKPFDWEDPVLPRRPAHRGGDRDPRRRARLLPGQADDARARGQPAREVPPRDHERDGRARPAGLDPAREVRLRRRQLHDLRPGRARGRARRFGLPLGDERAVLAGDASDLRLRHRRAAHEVPAQARHRRMGRLLRPHRARPRLRSGRHEDPRRHGAGRLQGLGLQDVDHQLADRRRAGDLGQARRRRDPRLHPRARHEGPRRRPRSRASSACAPRSPAPS